MSVSEAVTKRHRRSFSPEFKREIIALCQLPDKTVASVCKEYDLAETAVRRWVRQAEIASSSADGSQRGGDGRTRNSTSDDRQRLVIVGTERLAVWVEHDPNVRSCAGLKPGTTTGEAEEIVRLRKHLRELIEERDILARAVGFFAKGTR